MAKTTVIERVDKQAVFDSYLIIKMDKNIFKARVSYHQINQIFLPFLKDHISIREDKL